MKTEQELIQEMRETSEGKLLVRYGFEPYNTESSARRVAEKAAEDISQLLSIITELDNHEGAEGWSKKLRERLSIVYNKYYE